MSDLMICMLVLRFYEFKILFIRIFSFRIFSYIIRIFFILIADEFVD